MLRRALTIAGSDSGGGAGIQADLKTFHNFGVYGASALAALTAQNTLGVQGVWAVPPEFLELQIRSVLSDIGADAIKTGMLFNAPLISAAARVLCEYPDIPLVIDPVMVAKGGSRLLLDEAIVALKKELLPRAIVVTPNIDEANVLTGNIIHNEEDMRRSAEQILRMGAQSVLIKGGHLIESSALDIFYDGKSWERLESPRIETRHTHGTGCTMSAAITACLAKGCSLIESIKLAKDYITEAIRGAQPIGQGIAPVNHLSPVLSSHRGSLI